MGVQKAVPEKSAVIAGYTAPRGSREYFGALILGMYENNKLKYIGHTGTGFTSAILQDAFEEIGRAHV